MELISLKKIDDLLKELKKKNCPWCDNGDWGITGIVDAKFESDEDIDGLRALPHFRIHKENDQLQGSTTMGADAIMPVVAVECSNCGYIYLFNYHSLNRRHHNKDIKQNEQPKN